MKQGCSILVLFIALFSIPLAAAGENEEAIDNIVVTGNKSAGQLRRDLDRAERDFYSIYNDLNEDNDYDVRCFYESPTGVRKKYQVCRPVFFSKARNREVKTRPIDPRTDPVIAEKLAKLRENIKSLAATNPELQAAIVRYEAARMRLAASS
jgi:hypothetical protein